MKKIGKKRKDRKERNEKVWKRLKRKEKKGTRKFGEDLKLKKGER